MRKGFSRLKKRDGQPRESLRERPLWPILLGNMIFLSDLVWDMTKVKEWNKRRGDSGMGPAGGK